jgi:hypothetical protein
MGWGLISFYGIGYNKEINLDQPIYKFIQLRYFLEAIEKQQLHFKDVSKWDDTWELPYRRFDLSNLDGLQKAIFEHPKYWPIYGTCFTENYDTDALWRIYSANRNSICFKTTPRKILHALIQYKDHANCYMSKVVYMNINETDVGDIFEPKKYIKYPGTMYGALIKRSAFLHEQEIRLLIRSFSDTSGINRNQDDLFVNLDYLSIIEEIILDPRLTKQEVEFNKLGFEYLNIPINQSQLYAKPKLSASDFSSRITECIFSEDQDQTNSFGGTSFIQFEL